MLFSPFQRSKIQGDVPRFVELRGDERCRLMMLCGLPVLLKFRFGSVFGLMRSQRSSECWELLPGLEASEAFGGFHHAGRRQAERHIHILPPLHIAADASHGAHSVLDCVGTGERAPELGRQTEAVDSQHLVEPFQDAGGQPRALRVRACGRGCATVVRPCRHRRVLRLAAASCAPRPRCVALTGRKARNRWWPRSTPLSAPSASGLCASPIRARRLPISPTILTGSAFTR